MTDPFEPIDTTGIDVAAAVAAMRDRISGLGDSITALQREADRLNERAAARMVVGLLDPPPVEPSIVVDQDLDTLAALSDSVEAMGRHAAAPPEDFDPRPFDAAEAVDGPIVAGAHGVGQSSGAFDALAAAPAFEPDPVDGGRPEDLPALDVRDRADTFAPPADVLSPTIAPDHPSVGGWPGAPGEPPTDADTGATVLEFTPRSLTDPSDAPAFGAVPDIVPTADPAPEPADVEPVAGPESPPRSRGDGLDAIASSESTDVPVDWDNADDEAAFDKFFSSDVEPEPAQRWLLNE